MDFFATRNFPKHSPEGSLYGIFRHCETKSFRGKLLILLHRLLSIKFLVTGNFLEHSTEGFLYGIFRHWDKKFSTENLDIPPRLKSKHFRYRRFSNTARKRSSAKIFGTETKNFRLKILIFPPASYPWIFSLPETFWNTALKGHSTEFFGTWDKKKFQRKLLTTPLLSINFFATGNLLKHSTEGFP